MSFVSSGVQKMSAGCCPHGMPGGACPICSGMGGGGSTRKRSNQMSWDECYAIGLMLKKNSKDKFDHQLNTINNHYLITFSKIVDIYITPFVNKIAQPIKTFMDNVYNSKIKPIINNVKKVISNITDSIKLTYAVITGVLEKLTTFVGETKKLVNDFFKKLNQKIKEAKKLKQLFLKTFSTQFELFCSKAKEIMENTIRKFFTKKISRKVLSLK